MLTEEVEALRGEIVKLHALITASADMCSTVEGNDPKLERTQALLELAHERSARVILLVEIASSPRLAVVS